MNELVHAGIIIQDNSKLIQIYYNNKLQLVNLDKRNTELGWACSAPIGSLSFRCLPDPLRYPPWWWRGLRATLEWKKMSASLWPKWQIEKTEIDVTGIAAWLNSLCLRAQPHTVNGYWLLMINISREAVVKWWTASRIWSVTQPWAKTHLERYRSIQTAPNCRRAWIQI